jgi:hypothetical protein
MNYNKPYHYQIQKSANASRPTGAVNINLSEIDFAPSADEVARRAYSSYGNRASLPDHAVQHWFDAEAQLLTERYLTWAHGFHNRT